MTVFVDPIPLHELREGGDGFERVITALQEMATRDMEEDLNRSEASNPCE